ncbi:cysteine peptidase family C39 domain-containing protein [Pseudarcicella hirudinis]|uniref:cysteine peptidase family C39 domain-containing protein n=1 Tax=Pseudarcicella hirudinis TaxID=1079859 RepID=UPI0035E8D51B
MNQKYKYFRQLDYMDCGPTCLRMIASFYGKKIILWISSERTHTLRVRGLVYWE